MYRYVYIHTHTHTYIYIYSCICPSLRMYGHLYVESLHPNVSGLRILFGNFDSTCLDAYTSILIGASIVAGAHLGDDLSFHVVGL